jgi:hypothetical protein
MKTLLQAEAERGHPQGELVLLARVAAQLPADADREEPDEQP